MMHFFKKNELKYEDCLIEVGGYETAKHNGNCIIITLPNGKEIYVDIDRGTVKHGGLPNA